MTSPSSSSTEAPDPAAPAATVTTQLSVSGMHCGSCAALIEETLTEQAGVTSASVDLEAARAVVEYDPTQLGVDQLAAAVAEAGYSAAPVG